MKNYLIDRKQVLLIATLVMVLTTIPYLLGYASQGDAWQFTGFLIGVNDGNSYIAKMLSGAQGYWLFRSPFSAEPQAGIMAFFPYLLLGKLTGGMAQHEQLVALFHLYRCLAGLLVSLAVHDFAALFIKDGERRNWTVAVVLFGGGLGWILALAEMKHWMESIPLDFLSPESFGFLALFGLPHLSAARALLFWGVVKYLDQENGLTAGILWLLMGFFQPLYIVIAWVVIAIHAAFETVISWYQANKSTAGWDFQPAVIKKAMIAGLVSSPFVLYNAAAIYIDPYFKAWTAQNILPSPRWGHYLVAYGLVLPFAILGMLKLTKGGNKKGVFLLSWLAAFPLLISAPIPTQRRLAEGFWVILGVGFFGFFKEQKKIPLYGKVLIGLILPTSFLLVWGAAARAQTPAKPAFVPSEQVEAYLYLKDIAPRNAIVLSSFETGNSLPAWAPVTVIQGHGPETIDRDRIQEEIEGYFNATRDSLDCGNYLLDAGIDYIFWGPVEESRWEWNPDLKSCLVPVYNADGYRIYQVGE